MKEFIIRPDSTTGKDTYIRSLSPTANYGNATTLYFIGATHANQSRRILLEFPIDSIIPYATMITVARVIMSRAVDADNPMERNLNWHRIIADWEELQATWNSRLTDVAWASAGGDYEATPVAQQFFMAGSGSHFAGEPIAGIITALLEEWLAGTHPNYGLLARWHGEDTCSNLGYARSCEYATESLRPYLYVAINDGSPHIIFPVAADAIYSGWAATYDTKERALIWPTSLTAADPPFTAGETQMYWGVSGTTNAAKQSWTLADPGIAVGSSISNVRIAALCWRVSDSYSSPMRIGLHIDGQDYWKDWFVPSAPESPTATDYAFDWALNPATGLAWTPADVGALEVVAESGAPATDVCYIGRLYGLITWTAGAPAANYQRDDEDIAAYMLALLQAGLPTNLDAQEAKWADGITLEDVATWHVGEMMQPQLPELPMLQVINRGITEVETGTGTGMRRIETYLFDVAIHICAGGEQTMSTSYDTGTLGDLLEHKIQRYQRAIIDTLVGPGQMDQCPYSMECYLEGSMMSPLMPDQNLFYKAAAIRFRVRSNKLTETTG